MNRMNRMNRLLQLLYDNREVTRPKMESDDRTIYLYDVIVNSDAEASWWGGVSAESVVKKVAGISDGDITVRINSPGGDVFAARAIAGSLYATAANVNVHIDGYAASAASLIAMAGDRIEMVAGGFLMIHKAWALAVGNADDMTALAALLNQIDKTIVSTYARRTGIDAGVLLSMMAEETWIGAEDAIAGKWVDSIAAEGEAKNAIAWDLSALASGPSATAAANERARVEAERSAAAELCERNKQYNQRKRNIAALGLRALRG